MNRQFPTCVLVTLLILLLGLSARPAAAVDWAVSLGSIDVFRDHDALEVGVDATFGEWRWGLVPNVGVHATTDESFFGFVGLRRPFVMRNGRWVWDLSFSVSGYEDGEGKNLGGVIEFRSGLEARRRLRGGTELGLGVYHLSNSSIYRLNPGTNSLLLRVVFPQNNNSRNNKGAASGR